MKDVKIYQKDPKVRFRRLKAFGAAFSLTLCLLGLGVGFFVADYNTRRITFGEDSLQRSYRLDNEGGLLFGTSKERAVMDVPPEVQAWSGRLWTLLPARFRAAVWATEAERALCSEILALVADEGDPAEGADGADDPFFTSS